jgi:hypothetical protein
MSLEKTGTQIEAVACEHHRNEQTDTREHSNRFKIVDIGRDVFRSTVLSIVPDFSKVHHLGSTAFVLHLPSSQYLSNPLMMWFGLGMTSHSRGNGVGTVSGLFRPIAWMTVAAGHSVRPPNEKPRPMGNQRAGQILEAACRVRKLTVFETSPGGQSEDHAGPNVNLKFAVPWKEQWMRCAAATRGAGARALHCDRLCLCIKPAAPSASENFSCLRQREVVQLF